MQIPRLGDLTAMRESSDRARTYLRFVLAKAINRGVASTATVALDNDPTCRPYLDVLQKAAIEAMTTRPDSDAGPLASLRGFSAAFLALVAPKEVLLRLTGRRIAPVNVTVATQSAGMVGAWVGEGQAIPVSRMSLSSTALRPTKLGGILAVTKELARSSDPAATSLVEADLTRGIAAFSNVALLDPTLDAIPEVRPASLTFGATEVPDSGDIETDVALVLAALSGGNPAAPYLVMSPRSALFLATRRSANGERIFPDLGLLGGFVLGVPVLVATAGAGDRVVGIDAAGIVVADLGIELDSSENATLEMVDDPTNATSAGSPSAPVPTTLTSLWAANSVGIKATRYVNWSRRSDAVAYLELAGSPLP
jgi:HK97 family phage major capsid protein